MLLSLALIGLLGGLITGVSPCILPVLPVLFFSGGVQAARPRRPRRMRPDGTFVEEPKAPRVVGRGTRPYLVVAGLVLSFSVFTLMGSLLLSLLRLPQDLLLYTGTAVLVIIGIGLIVPRVQHLLEKPFSLVPQRSVGTQHGGFVLGLALGAVYVPCAGPVLTAITVAGATGEIGVGTVVLTLAFSVGAAIPLLAFALAGRRLAERVTAFRRRQRTLRVVSGVVMIALAGGLVLDVPQALQRLIPDYTGALQRQLAASDTVTRELNLGGIVTDQNRDLAKCSNGSPVLQSCGMAPPITGIEKWFNTPGGAALDLASLRGKVVLVDFWTYACINCQRSLPHLVGWNRAYKDAGLQVIGIHSPEYAFEKVPANVQAGQARFGVDYPVALDNSLSTWTNYRNRYWPARYLIDATGVVRQITFGEGGYATTEALLRQLLTQADPTVTLPPQTTRFDTTPDVAAITPETYLSLGKVVNYAGVGTYTTGLGQFSYPSTLPKNSFALAGEWDLGFQGVTAPNGGTARLNYSASEVRLVLEGEGTVTYRVGGVTETLKVTGVPNSYAVVLTPRVEQGTLDVEISPGVRLYSFTFG